MRQLPLQLTSPRLTFLQEENAFEILKGRRETNNLQNSTNCSNKFTLAVERKACNNIETHVKKYLNN
jgi:hypothetical protein